MLPLLTRANLRFRHASTLNQLRVGCATRPAMLTRTIMPRVAVRSFATREILPEEYTTKGEEEEKLARDAKVVQRRKKARTGGGANATSKLAKKASGPTWEWIPPARKIEEKNQTSISGKDRPVSKEPHYATAEIAANAAAVNVPMSTFVTESQEKITNRKPTKVREFRDEHNNILKPEEIEGIDGETAYDEDGDEYYVNSDFVDPDIDSGDISAENIPDIEDISADLTDEEMDALDHWTADELFGEKIAGIPVIEGVRFTPEEVVEMLERNAAKDVVVIDLSDKVAIVNTLVVCTGRSTQHMRKLAKLTYQGLKARKLELVNPRRPIEGYDLDDWILVDTGDMVINFFSKEGREFYDVERYWNIEYDERQEALRVQEEEDDKLRREDAGMKSAPDVKPHMEEEDDDIDYDEDEEWEDDDEDEDEDDEEYDEDADEEVDMNDVDTDELLRSLRRVHSAEEKLASTPKYWKK